MINKKRMPEEVRKKVKTFIKNKIDISDLIKDYSVKDEDLSRAIIKNFNRIFEDCSNTNFSRAIIGEQGNLTDLSSSSFNNCNFHGARFIGRVKAQNIIATNCNFNRCYFPFADYRKADFRGSTFCDAVFKISGGIGKDAKFDRKVIDDLFKDFIIT